MIKNFPNHTSPFWNMKQNGDGTAAKIDVIISGQETIGSAERSSDTDEMWNMFHTISDGLYANLLYDKFGKNRVEAELKDFLDLDFIPRVGGGIGLTRLIRANEDYKLRQIVANMQGGGIGRRTRQLIQGPVAGRGGSIPPPTANYLFVFLFAYKYSNIF